jgi:hypothetical protein
LAVTNPLAQNDGKLLILADVLDIKLQDLGCRLFEPLLDVARSLLDRHRFGESPGAGSNPDECKQDCRAKSNRLIT